MSITLTSIPLRNIQEDLLHSHKKKALYLKIQSRQANPEESIEEFIFMITALNSTQCEKRQTPLK